jgi:hypothetical protein
VIDAAHGANRLACRANCVAELGECRRCVQAVGCGPMGIGQLKQTVLLCRSTDAAVAQRLRHVDDALERAGRVLSPAFVKDVVGHAVLRSEPTLFEFEMCTT